MTTTVPRRWTAAQTREAAEMWAAGVPASKIGQAIGRSTDAVTNKMARLGIRTTTPPGYNDTWWPEAQAREATELWLAGMSAAKIGLKLGVSKNSVIGKMRRLGIKPPPLRRVSAPRRAERVKPRPLTLELRMSDVLIRQFQQPPSDKPVTLARTQFELRNSV